MARPKKEIDQETFESLCQIMCTKEEICGVLKITDKTLDRWCKETYHQGYSEVYKMASAEGKKSLRRCQFDLAKKSAAMAIFLGKNYLGQRDSIEYEDNTALNKLDSILAEVKDNAFKEAE